MFSNTWYVQSSEVRNLNALNFQPCFDGQLCSPIIKDLRERRFRTDLGIRYLLSYMGGSLVPLTPKTYTSTPGLIRWEHVLRNTVPGESSALDNAINTTTALAFLKFDMHPFLHAPISSRIQKLP